MDEIFEKMKSFSDFELIQLSNLIKKTKIYNSKNFDQKLVSCDLCNCDCCNCCNCNYNYNDWEFFVKIDGVLESSLRKKYCDLAVEEWDKSPQPRGNFIPIFYISNFKFYCNVLQFEYITKSSSKNRNIQFFSICKNKNKLN